MAPPETTIWSYTMEKVEPGEAEEITVGRPIDNTSIYILDMNAACRNPWGFAANWASEGSGWRSRISWP